MYSSDNRITKHRLNSLVGFLAFFQLLVLIVTLATKDPIFEAIGLPKEYEWLAGLVISGFSLWQFYLNPLKERVVETEKEVGVIKNDITHIKGTTDKLEQKFFGS
jgi:hypothetical protein